MYLLTILLAVFVQQCICDNSAFIPTVRAFSRSAVNCCSLNESSLQAMKERNRKCPSVRDTHSALGTKCQNCEEGLFRVDRDCFCSENFLSSLSAQAKCKAGFGKPWPESIGIEDIFYRSCLDDPPTLNASAISCCALSKSSLLQMRGLSDSCPSESFKQRLRSECAACPAGTCRVIENVFSTTLLHYCYCPEHFLTNTDLQAQCRIRLDLCTRDRLERRTIHRHMWNVRTSSFP